MFSVDNIEIHGTYRKKKFIIFFFSDARGDEVDSVAQLIADSTERKFKINNIFKGMWKKKHYSFDLS